MNEQVLSNLQEALSSAGVEVSNLQTQTSHASVQQESHFIDEIVPLQTSSKETQYSGK